MRYTLLPLALLALLLVGCGSSSDGGDDMDNPGTHTEYPHRVEFSRVHPTPGLTPADLAKLVEDSPNHFVATFWGGDVARFSVGEGTATDGAPVTQTDDESLHLHVRGARTDGVNLSLERDGQPSRSYLLMPSGNG